MFGKILAVTSIAVAAAISVPAQAQVHFEFGVRQPGYDAPRYYEPRGYRHAGERYGFRGPAVRYDDDDDCRIIVKRRVNRFGEVVVRRMRICD